jgi:predicted phage terminase large subunit-like protein
MTVATPALPPITRDVLLRLRLDAILQAQEHIVPFAQLMRPIPEHYDDPRYSRYLPARHHWFIGNVLEDVANGVLPRVILSAPPRSGKTEETSKLFPAWFLGKFPERSLILATYNETYSRDLGRACKDYLLSSVYRQVFPNTSIKAGRSSANRIETTQGGLLMATGVGGSVTGRGGHVLIGDDLIKSKEQADSPGERDKAWQWYNAVFRTRLMDDKSAMLLVATRWHEDDVIGRITDPDNPYYDADEAKLWTVINLPAIAMADDPLGRAEGEVLWPERFGEAFLESQRRSDPRTFAALYQGVPSVIEGNLIKQEWITTYRSMRELPEKLRYYMSMDIGVTKHGDRSCVLPIGIDRKNEIWVLPDIWWQRGEVDITIEGIIKLLLKYKPLILWGEKGIIARSIGPFLRKRMMETGAWASIEEMHPMTGKEARASSIIGRMSQKRVHFPAFAPWWPKALDEMLKFPAGTYDDFVDALALVGLGLMRQVSAKEESAPEGLRPGTFAHLKAIEKRETRMIRLAKGASGW